MASQKIHSLFLKQNHWKSISLIQNRSVSSTSALAGASSNEPPTENPAWKPWEPSKPGLEQFVPVALLTFCAAWIGNEIRKEFSHDDHH